MNTRILYAVAAAGVCALAAQAFAQEQAPMQEAPLATPQQQQLMQSIPNRIGSVYDALMADPRFGMTMKMVYLAGDANRLESAQGPLTVFAATNQGWSAGDFGGYTTSLSSTGAVGTYPVSDNIIGTLRGFFVHGAPTLQQPGDVRMQSAAGRPIEFDRSTMTVKWVDPNGETKQAKVVGQPILASNGVIYPVDAVVGS